MKDFSLDVVLCILIIQFPLIAGSNSVQFLGLTSLVLLGNEDLYSYNHLLKFLLVEPIYCLTSLELYVTVKFYVDDVFKLALSLNWAAFFRSAATCESRGDISIKQSFVVSVYNIRGTTTRNFEGFFVEYFAIEVVGAKVVIYEFDEFGSDFGLDGLK